MATAKVYGPNKAATKGQSRPTADLPAIGELFKGLFHDLMTLISQELRLAQVKMQEKAARGLRATLWMLGGGLLAFAGLVGLLGGTAWGYSIFLPPWLAVLLVSLLAITIGTMVIQMSRRQLGTLSVVPRKTLAALQADRALFKEKSRRTRAREAARRVWQAPPYKRRVLGKERTMWQILKEIQREWSNDKASQLAAALAYYTAVSIAPLLVLVVVIVGVLLGRQAAEAQLLEQLRNLVGGQAAEFLQTALANAQQPSLATWAGALSLLTLLWGSTNVFSQLQTSLNTIWGVEPRPGLGIWATVRARALSFAMVLGAALLLLASVIISSVLSAIISLAPDWLPGSGWIWQGVNYLISLAIITLVLATVYKVLPDAEIGWRHVWLGAAVTSLLFILGQAVLAWYLSNAGSTYGAVGSLVVFLLWVYYSAQILFLGAEFTQVYARHYGQGIQPSANAVRTADAV